MALSSMKVLSSAQMLRDPSQPVTTAPDGPTCEHRTSAARPHHPSGIGTLGVCENPHSLVDCQLFSVCIPFFSGVDQISHMLFSLFLDWMCVQALLDANYSDL